MNRIAAHRFNNLQDITFNAKEYSKFKYGSTWHSFAFGVELGKALWVWVKENVANGETVHLSGAPYNNIPVASTALCNYACMYLQTKCSSVDFKTFKIDREHSYDVDYGNMSAEEREALISQEEFYVDINHLKGEHVILIDDILISGAHERNMQRMVAGWSKHYNVAYAYYAVLNDSACCPTIEASLNYAEIAKDGSTFESFIFEASVTGQSIALNTRAVKFMLAMEQGMFNACVQAADDSLLNELLMYAYANKYNINPKYAANCKLLKELLIDE